MFSRLLRRKSRRDIFRYWDGKQYRYADPLVIWQKLWSDPTVDPNVDFTLATGIDSDGNATEYDADAERRVLEMIRNLFGVRQWTESSYGLTVRETFTLMWEFLRYINDLKKKHAPLPTQSPRSDWKSSEKESITPPEPDSSSTPTESTEEDPASSSKRSVVL